MTTTVTSVAGHDDEIACSFCGKSRHEVTRVVAGPGVYICNECIALCDEIIREELSAPVPDWDQMDDDHLLAEVVRVHASHDKLDRTIAEIVQRLRTRGVTWARIGEALGMTRQSAWERFSGEE